MEGEISAVEQRLLGVIITWSIFILFFILGKLIPPPRELQVKPGTYGDLWKGKNRAFSRCSKRLIVICGEAMVFPKFYAVFFGALPAAVAVASLISVEEDLEETLFLNITELGTLRTEQMLLSEVVYCFVGCMFTVFLGRLNIFAAGWEKNVLYEKLPLQYSEKIFDQFAIIGSVLLLLTVVTVVVKNEPDFVDEDDLFKLTRASVLVGANLFVRFGYKGYIKSPMLVQETYGAVEGTKLYFNTAAIVLSLLILWDIGTISDMAEQCFYISFVAFIVIPNVFWLLSFSIARLPNGESNRSSGHGEYGQNTRFEIKHSYFSVENKQQKIGTKHFICVGGYCPGSGVFWKAPTETEISARMYASTITVISSYFFTYKEGCWVLEALNTMLWLPLRAFGKIFVMISEACLLDEHLGNPTEESSLGIISPPMNRCVFHQIAQYSSCIFFVDGPGINVALGYFNRYLQISYSGPLEQRVTFFFKCSSYTDYWTLQHGLSMLLADVSPDNVLLGDLDFVVMLKGSCTSIIHTYSIVTLTPSELSLFLESKCTTMITSFESLDLEAIQFPASSKSTALISIGTSYTNNLARFMAKKVSLEKNFFDIVLEDSIGRQPTKYKQ